MRASKQIIFPARCLFSDFVEPALPCNSCAARAGFATRVVNEWAVFGHSNMPHSSTCSFEYSNIFEYVVQHDLIFKMSHIEAKSVNKWLRYQLKQVHIYGGCFRTTWTCFSWYLSHLLTDFASIWLIWMSSILSFEWTNNRWEKRSFEYSNHSLTSRVGEVTSKK